jgi:hypothetical protein
MLGPPATPNQAAQQIRGTIPFLTYNTLFEACFKKYCLRGAGQLSYLQHVG